MMRQVYRPLWFLLGFAVSLLFWSVAGASGAAGDLSGVVQTINEGNDQAKLIAAGLIILFGSLLSIGIVILLYKRANGSS